MSGAFSWLALGVLLGWAGFVLSGLFVNAGAAAGIGLAFGASGVLLLRNTLALRGAMALLAPFGVMLPALAMRHAAATLGLPVPGFASRELAAFLLIHTGFLAAAFGALPLNLYRLGYAPAPVTAMVLATCAHGAVTGNWFLPLVAVLGQLGWTLGWGSSNWFDHVTHVLLVPVVAIVLAARLLAGPG